MTYILYALAALVFLGFGLAVFVAIASGFFKGFALGLRAVFLRLKGTI
jgi:hypothetical protein